jgi:hypothetical protein
MAIMHTLRLSLMIEAVHFRRFFCFCIVSSFEIVVIAGKTLSIMT